MRTGSGTGTTGINWLFGDHLGSQSVTADASGSKTAEIRFKAWGEDRYTSGSTPTSYRYTGQRIETSLSIYYYGARWYDPSLGRFLSADTVIPEASQGVQAWDRMAYANNNPIINNDPTGHAVPLPPRSPSYSSIYIPVNYGLDLISAAVLFVVGGFLPVHFEGNGFGEGAIVEDTPQQLAEKSIIGIASTIGVRPFEVGMTRDLHSRSTPGDDLTIHHAPQGAPAESVFPSYNYNNAPGIVIPGGEHIEMNATNVPSTYTTTPRDLMAKTLWDLRQFTDAPNSALRELVDLVHKVFPGALDKK